jgi:polyisoprenoid-binding protein YceI
MIASHWNPLRTLSRLAIIACAVVALTGAARADARSFAINSTGWSQVTFVSDAPIENITGVTTVVSGTLVTDVAAPAKGGSADVTVDLAQVKTGVDKRDEHMRSADFLDTAKFPTASFQLTSLEIKGDPRAAGGATATGKGKLTIKGVTREISVPVKVAFRPLDDKLKALGYTGDVLRVTGKFSIQLSDFGIKVPAKLGQKISNTVEISIALIGVAGK